ncbi:hypothetical protein ARC20_10055 [Stenotrophomonas panacihumi]|uniref:DUF6265 domain-containing protein n=1 Tax=Stenotrophomonas panacihumi TaxID=676599 RepID=A0A0R0AM91_9GAMM|nr:DUF6265 family protein [Stenotrophomonas panacihumi]KRG43378.1 hypothetical protein ARC20_10055 [Stenotrophomonas panacihumi]PTN55068.1 hypothetical protein C9J98_07675 [Stenotrophomonas panacihumi]
MRTFLCLALLFLGGVMPLAQAAEAVPARLQSLAWLLGSWEREGLREGSSGVETWQVVGDAFVGSGKRLKGTTVAFEEKLRLEANGTDVFYVADVAENPQSVRFRMVEQAGTSAVFENPAHDFPKRIAYRLEGDQLVVVTSGDGREVTFRFKRVAASR